MMINCPEEEAPDELYLQSINQNTKDAVLDGGAQPFVVGHSTLMAYADYLRVHGVKWQPTFHKSSKVFPFGNDQVNECAQATIIPASFAGYAGLFWAHVLEGNTPFLFPRPLMATFGLVIDFGRNRLQWGDNRWQDIKQRNARGHRLLDLAEDTRQMQ